MHIQNDLAHRNAARGAQESKTEFLALNQIKAAGQGANAPWLFSSIFYLINPLKCLESRCRRYGVIMIR